MIPAPHRRHHLRGAAAAGGRGAWTSCCSSCSTCRRARATSGAGRPSSTACATPRGRCASASSASTSTSWTRTSRSTRRCIHGGIANERQGRAGLHRLREARGRGLRRGAVPGRRHPGAGRLRQARHRGDDPRHRVRPRPPDPVLRHLPRDADGDHRVRPQRLRARARQLLGVRPRHAVQGDLQAARAGRRRRPWAAPCAWASTPASSSPARSAWEAYQADTVWERHRHRYEVNLDYVPIFEQHGMADHRALSRPHLRRDDRDPGPPVVRGLPVPPGVEVQAVRAAPAVRGLRQGRARAPGGPAAQASEGSARRPHRTRPVDHRSLANA